MRIKMFSGMDKDKANAAIAVSARRKPLSVDDRHFVLFFVIRVMDDLVDS